MPSLPLPAQSMALVIMAPFIQCRTVYKVLQSLPRVSNLLSYLMEVMGYFLPMTPSTYHSHPHFPQFLA